MLTLLLGPDWVANRDAVLHMVADEVAAQKEGQILIVPELISHNMERRLAACAGDTCSRFAEVLTFTRLAKRVVDAAGVGAMECLDGGGRVVAMASAARQLHSRLKAYASVETKPEFLTGLVDAVDEFKRCCISAQDLRQAAGQTEGAFSQKLEELSLLLESYDALCARGRRDPRDQMTWVLEQLEDSDFAQTHSIYLDGFPDLTRQHMAIMEHFMEYSSRVVVSLNCDCPNSGRLSFEKAGKTAGEFIRLAEKHGIPYEIRSVAAADNPLLPVANALFQGPLRPVPELSSRLHIYRSETVFSECTQTAEKIMDLVEAGARYRDISVVCSDLSSYRNVLPMVFGRCRIPCYLSGTEDILEKTVIATVLSALDAALGGFRQKDMIQYMRSALSPLELQDCDLVENYTIVWKISGNRWLKPWVNHPRGLEDSWEDRDRQLLSRLNNCRERLILPLEVLAQSFRKAEKLSQQVEALGEFLTQIGLSRKLAAMAEDMDAAGDNRNAQILSQLWEILLSALEQLYDVLGDTKWDSETFTRLLKLLLSQYDVGTIPPVLDTVTVGAATAMRCQQCKYLFVLGTMEGAFPGYGGSSGVLSDQERVALREMGVPLTGGSVDGLQAEFADIYGVFCGASQGIYLSCPSGQPSFVYKRLAKLSGGEENPETALGAARADPGEAMSFLLRSHAEAYADVLQLGKLRDSMMRQKSHDLGTVDREHIRSLYGRSLTLSASQIDRQADCRLSYFLQYGIKARERKEAAVDPAEFGTYVHWVLEKTAGQIMGEGGFHQTTLDHIQAVASGYSDTYAKDRFRSIESERLSYLFRRNSQELKMVVEELWQELQQSQFAPLAFELGFGDGADQELDPIPIPGKTMDAKLQGYVDRVDTWEQNSQVYYRVVDYKTGKKDFDYCDVFNGLGLQMLLYMFALEQSGQALLGEHPVAAGVQYFPARAPFVPSDGVLTDDQAQSARKSLWKRKGLLLKDEAVLEAMEPGEDPSRLSYSRKKDGSISGDLADRQQLRELKTYVYDLLSHLVDDIASGNVTPNPYTRGSTHSACAFCPYGDVCHMDFVEGRRNYKAMNAQRFWEEIEKEMKDRG